MGNLPFVINDRRGQAKPPREDIKMPELVAEEGDKSSWKNVGYMVVLGPGPQGPQGPPIMLGRAIGLRSDEMLFVADYILPPVWKEDFVWQPAARKRLDTFLGCACIRSGSCSTHGLYLRQWKEADVERFNSFISAPLPEAIEIMFKAEMARQQSSIVIPGR